MASAPLTGHPAFSVQVHEASIEDSDPGIVGEFEDVVTPGMLYAHTIVAAGPALVPHPPLPIPLPPRRHLEQVHLG